MQIRSRTLTERKVYRDLCHIQRNPSGRVRAEGVGIVSLTHSDRENLWGCKHKLCLHFFRKTVCLIVWSWNPTSRPNRRPFSTLQSRCRSSLIWTCWTRFYPNCHGPCWGPSPITSRFCSQVHFCQWAQPHWESLDPASESKAEEGRK